MVKSCYHVLSFRYMVQNKLSHFQISGLISINKYIYIYIIYILYIYNIYI